MAFDDDRKTYKHESYGAITINRSSGSAYLFGSDALHHQFVHIEIKHAEMNRDLSHNWIYSGGVPITEIWMTEAQWAEFVSSFGQGSGVACTIRGIEGRTMQLPPEPEHFTSEFKDEVKKTVGKAVGTLKGLTGQLDEALLPGNKALGKKDLGKLLSEINHAIMQIEANLPYVETCFEEEMEKKMSEAKVEFEAVVANRLREMGIQHVIQQYLPETSIQRGAGLLTGETDLTKDPFYRAGGGPSKETLAEHGIPAPTEADLVEVEPTEPEIDETENGARIIVTDLRNSDVPRRFRDDYEPEGN
jgi:hypothetical protein